MRMRHTLWIVTQCGVLGICAIAGLSGCETVEPAEAASVEPIKNTNDIIDVAAPKARSGALEERYLVIDISGGQAASNWPVTYLDKVPSEGWNDEYKTGKIVLRKVNPGSYWHQDCTAEEAWKRKTDNVPREIVVNKPFYIGVFEITQRQYEHVTGMKPSRYSPDTGWEKLPVENVSYEDIRGRCEGANYPRSTDVDAQSFMGILRQKTGLKALDLPSESVWEYSCSAGGAYIEARQLEKDAIFSRYPTKASRTAPAEVGSCQPNTLGLYDMQGNVHEWCLDSIGTRAPGAVSFRRFGCKRVVKGGFYDSLPELCNPSITFGECASFGNSVIGFRICRY